MSLRMAPITLQAGANPIILRDEMSQIGAIMIRNESDWDLSLGGVGNGTLGQGAWVEQLYVYDNIGDSISVIAAALPGITITLNTIVVTLWRKGEPLPNGTWPVPLVRKIASSIITAQQVIQDGLASGLTEMEATPSGSGQTILVTTDGACRMVSYSILPGVGGVLAKIDFESPYLLFRPPESGATPLGFGFQTWTGSGNPLPLTIGAGGGGLTAINDSGGITALGGVATAGPYGVSMVRSVTKDIAVTDNLQHTVCTFTTPNDGVNHIARVWLQSWVGAGNTNPANFVCPVSYTDPIFGAVAPDLSDYFSGHNYNGGFTYVQGQTYPSAILQFECTPNSTVTLKYQNSQAGTISDHASGTIELLA